MVFEASTEHEAWVQAMTLKPDIVPGDWEVKLNEQFKPPPVHLDQGPVEIDDWDFDPTDIPE